MCVCVCVCVSVCMCVCVCVCVCDGLNESTNSEYGLLFLATRHITL